MKNPLNYLPWCINDLEPRTILDSSMCVVLNLSVWGAVGKGHNGEEIAKFIVGKVNENSTNEDTNE